MSKKHKKVCTVLSYTELLLILSSKINRYISILAFLSLAGILIGISSCKIG